MKSGRSPASDPSPPA